MTTPDQPWQQPYSAPPPPDRESAVARPPDSVTLSFWMGIASVVVGFAMMLASFLSIDDAELGMILREAQSPDVQLSMQEARTIYTAFVVGSLVFMAVVAALWIMFLFFMRRGRNWARIVITVVGIIWFVVTGPALLGGSTGGATAMLLALLQMLAVGATVVCAWLTPSNQYFATAKRR